MADGRATLFIFYLLFMAFAYSQEVPKPTIPCPLQAGTNREQYFDILQMRCKPCSQPNTRSDESGKNLQTQSPKAKG